MTQSDAELAAAFQAGDDRAYAQLYERYRRGLFAFAARMLCDNDTARDLVQDVFVAIYQKRGQLQRPECFRSWLFAIGRNRCLASFRRERGLTSLEDLPERAAGERSPAEGREAEEDLRLVRCALQNLRIEYREVLILREYQNLSYCEIAEITGATESAVKSRLFKARKALHQALKPAFAERS